MKQAILSELSPVGKLGITAIIILAIFFIFFVLAVLIAILVFRINFFESAYIFTDLTNQDNINIIKFFQIIQSVGLFLVPPFLLGYLFENNSFKYLTIKTKPNLFPVLFTGIVMFAAIPLINFLASVNSKMSLPEFMSGIESWMKYSESEAQKITEAFVNVSTISGFLTNMLMIAIIPAFGEELLFRGVIQRIFKDWTKNIHWAVFITAFLFSAMHLQFYGFIPRFLMGVFFGYLFAWSGTIWLPIIAHFINNCFAVVFSYLLYTKVIEKNIDTIGSSADTLIYVVFSIIITSSFIYLIYKKVRRV
ncbi:MAG: hypothetical protein A2046_09400 [Bacteroidetes bacterium GWA2_30_7]|nr:MAG: hypothetical protein A2046_09400 [Bacteroidetes bacterium GWA2_30_7]